MRLEEKPVGAGGYGSARENRDELTRSAAAAARALPGALHAVRRVEDDRRLAARAEAHEAAHVHNQITVPEERAALGNGDLAAAFRRPDLRDRADHPLRLHPLPLLHVHGPARAPRGDEEIGLPAEERRDLEHIRRPPRPARTARAGARR